MERPSDSEIDDLFIYVANYSIPLLSVFAESTIVTIAHRLRTVIDYDRVSVLITSETTRAQTEIYKQVMLLEQGKIIEFDRYAVFWWKMRKKLVLILFSQACHLVERYDLQILFVVPGNGKRGICNVEKNGWSLDLDGLVDWARFISVSTC